MGRLCSPTGPRCTGLLSPTLFHCQRYRLTLLSPSSASSQVQLDGTVRTSGLGAPSWAKLVDDLPKLDDIRTGFTDGIGPSI